MAVTPRDFAAEIVGQRMTLDEFLELPETNPALEFVDGMVTQKVAPQAQHVRLQLNFATRINAFTEPQKMASAFPELRATYAGLSRVPDVAVYLWNRIPRLPNGRIANRFTEPPDIAVEIVSPGQSVYEVTGETGKVLIPAVDAFIIARNFDEGEMTVRPIPGLLDG